jgi:ABC-type sugar transport system substrate-binding protein
MKRKKYVVVVGLILILAMSFMMLAGCGGTKAGSDVQTQQNTQTQQSTQTETSKAPEKAIVLGNVVVTLENSYHQAEAKHFEAYAKEKYGADVMILDGKMDTPTIVSSLDQLVAKKVDAIVIQCIMGDTINEGIKAANAAGIPVLPFYNKPTQVSTPFLAINEAVTSTKMGEIAAKKWKEFYPDKPIMVGMIDFLDVITIKTQRSDPFWQGVLNVDPNAKLVSRLDGGGTREKAMAVAQDMLQAHPEINIFYGVVSDFALGALSAFEAAGRGKAKDGVPLTEIIVGTDAPQSELVKVFDPNSSFKITQGLTPKENAILKVDTMMAMIKGEIPMDKEKVVDAHDMEIDYWNSNIDDTQKWLEEQYFTKIDLKSEMAKK